MVSLGGTYGVMFTEGELWKDQRRFALHVLRNFGMGKNVMQEKVRRFLNEQSSSNFIHSRLTVIFQFHFLINEQSFLDPERSSGLDFASKTRSPKWE